MGNIGNAVLSQSNSLTQQKLFPELRRVTSHIRSYEEGKSRMNCKTIEE